jgi:hypothetical protein
MSRRSARSEPAGFLVGLNAVVAAAGSVAGAARELDVPRRTLRRWLTGESKPPAARAVQVARRASTITRRARLLPATERRIRRARVVEIKCIYRYDVASAVAAAAKAGQSVRARDWSRTIRFHIGAGGTTGIGDLVASDTIGGFLAGWSGLDPGPGLFQIIADAMTDDWYRQHMQEHGPQGFDIERVKFV